jgi:hypothetical protein
MYICILLTKKQKIKFIFRNYFGNIVDIREGFFWKWISLPCCYTRQSSGAAAEIWREPLAGTKNYASTRLAGVYGVLRICRVSTWPTVVANRLPGVVYIACHHGQQVCRVPPWPGAWQTQTLPWSGPTWHMADLMATAAPCFPIV